ncbi:hypothetical protein QLR68_23475, partial [Micromonospora sp. DH15]|nr:hypothetical protein [Micromonospora sp. DH15]
MAPPLVLGLGEPDFGPAPKPSLPPGVGRLPEAAGPRPALAPVAAVPGGGGRPGRSPLGARASVV